MGIDNDSALGHGKLSTIKNMDIKDLQVWVVAESNFWKKIAANIEHAKNSTPGRVGSLTQYSRDKISKYIKNLTDHASRIPGPESTSLLLSEIKEALLPSHDEPVAPQILNYSSMSNTCLESALFSYAQSMQVEINAYEIIYTKKSVELEKFASAEISRIVTDFEAAADSIRSSLTNKTKTTLDDLKTATDGALEKLENALSAGEEAVKISEPVKFWNERRVIHQENAKKYASYAAKSATLFLSLLILLIIYEYASTTQINFYGWEFQLPKNNFSIAFLIVFTTAGVWSTRIFIKLMMSNMSLETESLERATMIKTYVAMTAVSGKPQNENETLFYTTLFRPANNSLSEEGTAPEFSRILEIIMKSKN